MNHRIVFYFLITVIFIIFFVLNYNSYRIRPLTEAERAGRVRILLLHSSLYCSGLAVSHGIINEMVDIKTVSESAACRDALGIHLFLVHISQLYPCLTAGCSHSMNSLD